MSHMAPGPSPPIDLLGVLVQQEINRPFHFADSQVVLQVEEQTYKIHRYFLTRESHFFKDLFSLPQTGDSESVEGSDNNPIKVPGTPTNEFENLLRFFYFGMHDDYVPSLTDWIALLSISTRLIFDKVRARAIKEITARLDQVDPFELIGLAVKYDVEEWLKPAYRRIVTRNNLITHQEALKVPFSMAVMLMRAREQYWRETEPILINTDTQARVSVSLSGHGDLQINHRLRDQSYGVGSCRCEHEISRARVPEVRPSSADLRDY
ncbi:hypothetical protein BJV77DRAFT_960655 [Russula vinacea]|nr:hypothetical protein BJV77DRAFT_960655 [Russula vinacea]